MSDLFSVETDRVHLRWGLRSGKARGFLAGPTPKLGRLALRPLRPGVSFGPGTARADVPEPLGGDSRTVVGPRLFEETDYQVFLEGAQERSCLLKHRDPNILRDLRSESGGRIVHGTVNFRSQIGLSTFTVVVDGRPEYEFELEVFPTKLDYATDYEALLADVQETLSGLALAYLRTTYQWGAETSEPGTSDLEWVTLLKHLAGELEASLLQVARQPARSLRRRVHIKRAETVQRCDQALRSALRRLKGHGRLLELDRGLPAREFLPVRLPESSLDTPEHRWLALQLDVIRRRVASLISGEVARTVTPRRKRTVAELQRLEQRVIRWLRLEPIRAAEGLPPQGFVSLQLIGRPGYREAYRACLSLSLGLRIEGGPLGLSVKDLSELYEMWCYLATLRVVSERTGVPVPTERLFFLRERGLEVLLKRGRETRLDFAADGSTRQATVAYNPRSSGTPVLVPQRPDILVSIEQEHWPKLHLLLDAKYRLDASTAYVDRYGAPGPPEDALNVLHRYRDALLEADRPHALPKRTVVQAAAAYPYDPPAEKDFRDSRLWTALQHIGIGAVPLLPGRLEFLEQWLGEALSRGGWELADLTIPYRSGEQATRWRHAARELVLVGVLRRDDPREHLHWIEKNRRYYVPLGSPGQQQRMLAAQWVALYSPSALRSPGAVTHLARVEAVDAVPRGDIATPWVSGRGTEALQVLYSLGQLERLKRPVENVTGQRFSAHRWTSLLSIRRATALQELLINTEPEWRLWEGLHALGIPFRLGEPQVPAPGEMDRAGRAWFLMDGARVRFAGKAGFLLRTGKREFYVADPQAVAKAVQADREPVSVAPIPG